MVDMGDIDELSTIATMVLHCAEIAPACHPQEKDPPMSIALAVDAGFGMMKYAHRDGGRIRFASFPSVAVPTRARPDLPQINPGRRTTLVAYEGHTYSVGPDVRHELAGNDFGRDLTDSYYTSHIYHTLMRGALALMGETEIDVLVLGLPMDRFDYPELIESLEKHYTDRIDPGFNRSVKIHRVIIHPQPFGGYVGLGRHLNLINETFKRYPEARIDPLKSADAIRDLNVLVVDSGAYTLDWLFMSPTGPVRAASAAANNAGRHRVVRRLYDLVSSEIGRKPPISFLFDIDDAERNNKPLRLDGRIFDFNEPRFQALIEEAIEDSVQQMFEHLGGNADRIDLIAVVGGEPNHIARAIAKRRPMIPLFVAPSHGDLPSIYTNLAGFQEYAEAMVDALVEE